MGATNHTPNYNLPQFLGTDKPAWLTDINGAFSDIDTAIKNAADDASSAVSTAGSASSAAASAVSSVGTLNTQINTPGTGLAAQVSSQGTAITNLSTTVGTTALPTLAQTVTGAIAEIYNSLPALTGLLVYEGTYTITQPFNGARTVGDAMDAAYTDLVSAFSNLTAGEYIRIIGGTYDSEMSGIMPANESYLRNTVPTGFSCSAMTMSDAQTFFNSASFTAGSKARRAEGTFSPTVMTSVVPGSGYNCQIIYEKYKINA